jgi:hypothetical protein
MHLRNTAEQPPAPLHHTRSERTLSGGTRFGRAQLTSKDSLAGAVQVTAKQFLSPVSDNETYAKLPEMILLHRSDVQLPRSSILTLEGFA